MLRFPTVFVIYLFFICNIFGQSSPDPTRANIRWQGYEQRQKLIENSLVKNLPFTNIGPTVMSGRVVDLAVNPVDPTHFFVAYASGGLWETRNDGASFAPLFDHEIVMTIGDIAVDWSDTTIYLGSGENNSSRSSYAGYGLFRSTKGKTWEHLGLEETHHIGRVILHPKNPNVIWVAALGHLYSENDQRGVYKSQDGGKSWKQTLYVNNQTGIVDLVINPQNPDELIAAAWDRKRRAWNFTEAGPGSALFKSTDGGETWLNITSGDNGFPDTENMGRVGLAYAASEPSTVYAVLDNQERRPKDEKAGDSVLVTRELLRGSTMDAFLAISNNDLNDYLDREDFPKKYNAIDIKMDVKSGKIIPADLVTYLEDANSMLFDTPVKGAEVYRSENGGMTWTKTHEAFIDAMVFSYGYYFGQIRVDPQNSQLLYILGVPLIKSEDGGKTWQITAMENVHADHHALWLNPEKTGHLINGNDGGINISYDAGETWIKCNSPAVGQFYTVNVDMAEPYNVYGGLQDNGVWKGPGNYEFSYEWQQEGRYPYYRLMGGDGMQVAIDTRDNETVYTGYQFGNYYRIDTKTGEPTYITPKHKLGEAPLRWNWQAPIILSGHNQDIVYFGSNKFHRSMNRGDNFETLSGDLTNGSKKGDVSYGTLTTISESPLQFGLIYTGSDDGLVHVSKDAGENWSLISGDLPKDYWISRVTASHHQKNRVYTSLNGYRSDNFAALLYVSENMGEDWEQLGTDLPAEPINVVKEDPVNENLLYVGTDHGAYVSLDRGETFMAFKEGLPAVPVHDLVIHPREKDLVLGTHGRSIYVAAIATLQQLTNFDSLAISPIPETEYSNNWGNKKSWHWDGFYEPKITLEVYAPEGGKAEISIIKEDLTLKNWSTQVDKGLNYITYDYTLAEDQVEALSSDQEKPIEKKENELFYLPAGSYEVRAAMNGKEARSPLIINKSKAKPRRKGSE